MDEKIELGGVMRGLDDLKGVVEKGFESGEKRFDKIDKKVDDNHNNLPCAENTKAIGVVIAFVEKENKKAEKWEKRKEILITAILKKVIPSCIAAGLIAGTAAVAYYKG